MLEPHPTDLAAFLTNDPKGRKVPDFISALAAAAQEEREQLTSEIKGLLANIEHIKEIVAMQQSYAKVAGITEDLAVAELVEAAVRMNSAGFQRHGVALKRQFEAVPLVRVDKHKVLQILINLLRNAKYAMEECAENQKILTLAVRQQGGRVKISVSDNGVGIAPENLTRIFGHGFTTKRDGHGFGLHSGALAANEMGGSLQAYSDGPGKGATFTLNCRLCHRTKTSMTNPSEPSSNRILVVDDNPSIHDDFRKILCPAKSRVGASLANLSAELFDEAPDQKAATLFNMDSAFQGQEALVKIQAAEQEGRPYSLAFMDVRMPPGWDGVRTISQIWKEYPHIQVVICTAYSDYSWAQILDELGETDNLVILKKPFDNVEVLQLAHTLTRKWSLNRQANARLADLDEMVRRRTQELTEANECLQNEIQRRSMMESALRESEERFHKAFETVPVACVIRPLDTGRYLDVNECFARLAGYSKEEILGKTPEELRLLVAPERYEQLIQSLRGGHRVRDIEVEIRKKSGQIRQVVESIELLKLGERTCLLAVLQDVTNHRVMEGQLRQAQKMEAVGQLAAGVAHDFNNLLTVIQGYASLQLAKSTLESDIAKAFTQVKLASERASALTRQLLAFSRKQVVQRKPCELQATLLGLKSMLSRILGETIRLECLFDPTPLWVNGDESGLEQVILNLSVNARDAMPQGGELSLALGRTTISAAQAAGQPDKRPGDFGPLTVSDKGCGMDSQTLSRIFEPFFTTKPIGRGTGLGLSTVVRNR